MVCISHNNEKINSNTTSHGKRLYYMVKNEAEKGNETGENP